MGYCSKTGFNYPRMFCYEIYLLKLIYIYRIEEQAIYDMHYILNEC